MKFGTRQMFFSFPMTRVEPAGTGRQAAGV